MAINNTKQVILSHPEEVVIYEIENKYNMPKIDGGKNKQFSQSRSMTMKRLWQDPAYRNHMSIVRRGRKLSEETKRKMSIIRKLRGYRPPSFLGRRHTEETKKKISIACIGRKHTKETKRKISLTQKLKGFIPPSTLGRKHTKETKKKISIARIGIKYTEETKKKMSLAHLNQITSFKNTSIEIKLFEILDKIGVPYSKHMRIDNICQSDALISSMKIAIFADGCYWHGCPVHSPQRFEKRERDERLTKLMRDNGWIVLRFWEHDIHNNTMAVEDIIHEKTMINGGVEIHA